MTSILALDTSSEFCSVSLVSTGTGTGSNEPVYRSLTEAAPRSHVQLLLPMVKELLSQGDLSLSDLSAIAFGRGPGSFTGLRIAAGFTQGLAYGHDLPVVSVSNLQALAMQGLTEVSDAQRCLTLIDARMDETYWGLYQRDGAGLPVLIDSEAVDKPEVLAEKFESVEPLPVMGSGLNYAERLGVINSWASRSSVPKHPAELIAKISLELFKRNETLSAEHASPVYIRDQVAWKKLPGRE